MIMSYTPWDYKRAKIRKPKHDKAEMMYLLQLVRKLNGIFCKNHYFRKQKIKPFALVWTYKADWYIVCDNYHVYFQDKRFKVFRKTLERKYSEVQFDWRFHLESEVWGKNKVFRIK